MIAKTVRKVSFWIGIIAVAAILLVPFVYRWLYPLTVTFVAAWVAREPRRTKWICGLPVLLVAIIYGELVAIGAWYRGL